MPTRGCEPRDPHSRTASVYRDDEWRHECGGPRRLCRPELRYGMTGLLAVLTTSTFLATSELYNSSFGIYALTHTVDYAIKIPTKTNLGSFGYQYFQGLAVYFAGLIVVDVANALLLLSISIVPVTSEDDKEGAAAESKIPGTSVVVTDPAAGVATAV